MPFDGRVERGLLMSAPLVVQTIEGRKTNTRRIGDRYRRWRKGDLVYIRETFWQLQVRRDVLHHVGEDGDEWWGEEWTWSHPDTDDGPLASYGDREPETTRDDEDWVRRPGIHMPKWAARIWCELTEDVRYVPLQSITDEDAVAEGVETGVPLPGYARGFDDPRLAFAALWNHINAKRGPEGDPGRFAWARNPEVAVLRYRLLSTTGRPA